MNCDSSNGSPDTSRGETATAAEWFAPGRFAALLALAIFAAFPKVVLGLHTLCYRDFGVLAYPTVFYHHESFWRGELPLWNPLSNCGAPFLAQWGTMVLYPFSLFYLVLPLPWSLNFFCLAHLFWAGWGMYFLARRWTEDRFAASLAGLAFVFNGVTLSCLIWPNYLVALGWMPWVVLWVERAWREGGRAVVATAVMATLQMLSGVPEIVLLTWLLIAGLWVETFVARSVSRTQLLGRVGLIVALASGLMAAQLLPFFDLLAHSQREPGFAGSKWSLPVWGWANQLVPLFRCLLTPQGVYFQIGQEFMSSTYLGIGSLVLGLAALGHLVHACTCRTALRKQRSAELDSAVSPSCTRQGVGSFAPSATAGGPQNAILRYSRLKICATERGVPTLATADQHRVWILGGLALFSLVMALGEHGFVYEWVRRGLPVMGLARYPVKFMVLAAFVFPLLAAYAVQALNCRGGTDARRLTSPETEVRASSRRLLRFMVPLGTLWTGMILTIGAILLVARFYPTPFDQWPAIWRSGMWRAGILTASLGLLAVVGRLATRRARVGASMLFLGLIPLDALTHVPLQNPTLPSSALAPGLWELSQKTAAPKLGEGRVLISPYAEQRLLMSRVANLSDDLLGKRLAVWSHLNLLEGISKVNGSSTLQVREQAQVQALLYAATNVDFPRLADFLNAAYSTAPGQIVEWTARSTCLPMVTGGQKPVFAEAAETLSALTNAAFHPGEVVYLPPEARAVVMVTNKTEVKVRLKRMTAQRIELDAEAREPSMVVLAQTFYAPWHADIDGAATPLWQANHAFQALAVPAGRHEVRLVYEDAKFKWGGWLSLLALMLCVVLWFGRSP